ncbi:response regulator [Vibrio salilacus]|uniref:response regulator n=1 Tax=Vibrio salilacus TaxID=1323749 RepID=UPI000C2AC7B8|nr:response regulator [Vibrio salilacus]
MKVMIADDHPIVLSGVKALIENQNKGFKIIAEATSVEALFKTLSKEKIDILITDYSMPNNDYVDGIAMINKIKREHHNIKIIVLTQMTNTALLNSLVRSGIDGVLLKKDVLTDIHHVISVVKNGGKYISPSVSNLILSRQRTLTEPSPKELEVLRLFSSGMSVSKIAIHTNRSIKTISTQKKQAMIKLGLEHDSEIYEYIKSLD